MLNIEALPLSPQFNLLWDRAHSFTKIPLDSECIHEGGENLYIALHTPNIDRSSNLSITYPYNFSYYHHHHPETDHLCFFGLRVQPLTIHILHINQKGGDTCQKRVFFLNSTLASLSIPLSFFSKRLTDQSHTTSARFGTLP